MLPTLTVTKKLFASSDHALNDKRYIAPAHRVCVPPDNVALYPPAPEPWNLKTRLPFSITAVVAETTMTEAWVRDQPEAPTLPPPVEKSPFFTASVVAQAGGARLVVTVVVVMDVVVVVESVIVVLCVTVVGWVIVVDSVTEIVVGSFTVVEAVRVVTSVTVVEVVTEI